VVSVLEVINAQTVLREDYMTFSMVFWFMVGLCLMVWAIDRFNLYDRVPLIGGSR
jgi:hypothetical protein